MMRKSLAYILFVSCVAALCVGCYDDKGNYDYHDVTEVRIDTAGLGILPAYAISRFDKLSIAPNIYYGGTLVNNDTSAPLDYMWTIYASATGAGVDYTVDTIGRSRVLDAEITRMADTYTVRLIVTNKETNLQTYFTVSCNVEGAISEGGWMVLYERSDKPGYSDVGLVVNSLTKKNVIQNREYWNLYGSSNGGPLEGKPVRVAHTVNGLPNDLVVLATDKNLVALNKGTFMAAMEFKDFFYEAPATCNVSAYGQLGVGASGEVLINDNKLYWKSGTRTTLLGVPMIGEYGQLSSWTSLYYSSRAFSAVVYDQTNRRFLYVPFRDVKLVPFATQGTEVPFDVNNVGSEMVAGDWGRSEYEYLLMKNGNDYHLAVADFYTSTTATTNVGRGWYNMSSSPNIAKVTSMTASYSGLYVLYGAESGVYNFAYSTGQPAEQLWSAPSSDEEVTCVKLQKFEYQTLFQRMLPNANAVLHIATWNEKVKEGKLYQYQINPANAALLGDPIIYTVPGKVKDMGWKYVLE